MCWERHGKRKSGILYQLDWTTRRAITNGIVYSGLYLGTAPCLFLISIYGVRYGITARNKRVQGISTFACALVSAIVTWVIGALIMYGFKSMIPSGYAVLVIRITVISFCAGIPLYCFSILIASIAQMITGVNFARGPLSKTRWSITDF